MDLPRDPRPSKLDLEIGRLLFNLETRLWSESLAAATHCLEDLAGALAEISDMGKSGASPVARRALKSYAS